MRWLVYQGRVDNSRRGGARHHFASMASALHEGVKGSLTVLVPGFSGISPLSGIGPPLDYRILASGPRGPLGFLVYEARKCAFLLRLARTWRGSREHVVYMSRLDVLGIAVLLARILRFRVVIEVNGLVDAEVAERGSNRAVIKLAQANVALQFRVAHLCIAVSEGIREASVARGASQSVTVRNGVDLRLFPLYLARQKGHTGRLIFVGALAPWVDLACVLESMTNLEHLEPGTPWHLEVVGDGPRLPELRQLSQDLGLAERITWWGWLGQEDVAERVSNASVGLAPLTTKGASDTCGSPLKVFEYLAMGRPVVGTHVDGLRELTNSLLFTYAPGNSVELARQVRKAATTVQFTERDLVQVRDSHSWDKRSSDVLAALNSLFHYS